LAQHYERAFAERFAHSSAAVTKRARPARTPQETQILTNLVTVLQYGNRFMGPRATAYFRVLVVSALDILGLGLTLDGISPDGSWNPQGPLEVAKLIEQTHAMLLQHPRRNHFQESDLDSAMGSVVACICEENQVDLHRDSAYTLQASPLQLCFYNLQCIENALSQKSGG
jgi:hypothetical protein